MAFNDCVICGEDHPRCNGHARIRDVDGIVIGLRPCLHWPRNLEPVCKNHGGRLQSVKAAGEARRKAAAAAADAEAALGFSMNGKIDDPLAAMEGLAAMAVAMTEALAERVNAIERIRYGSDYGIEQLRAEVSLLERSMDRTGRLLELVAKHRPDGEAAAAVNLLTSLSDTIKGLELD